MTCSNYAYDKSVCVEVLILGGLDPVRIETQKTPLNWSDRGFVRFLLK